MIRDKQKMKRKDVGLDAFGPFLLSCRTLRRWALLGSARSL
jgi:hypothetical protein